MKARLLRLARFIAIISIVVGAAMAAEVKTGGTKLIQVDGKYNVWTKKIGDGPIKLLLLHGGPGFPHDYFECFEDFLPKEGITFYYYDQLGCGNSDIPDDTSLWTIPRYVEEVEQVRKGLGLDQFYLLGQSWGSMLAMEYLFKYQDRVRAAVLCNMTASGKDYAAYTNELKHKLLSREDVTKLDALDRAGKWESPEYQTILMEKLYPQVICRINPWPEPVMRSLKKLNTKIYNTIQGVDEFHVTGSMKDWNAWDRLKEIRVPTLLIGATHDEMNPGEIKEMGRRIPNSAVYICPDGSHLSMYDDQQNFFRELLRFLKGTEAKLTKTPQLDQRPNKAPEPTPVSVTPRAKEGTSK